MERKGSHSTKKVCNLRNMLRTISYPSRNLLQWEEKLNDESIIWNEIYTSFNKFPLNCWTNGAFWCAGKKKKINCFGTFTVEHICLFIVALWGMIDWSAKLKKNIERLKEMSLKLVVFIRITFKIYIKCLWIIFVYSLSSPVKFAWKNIFLSIFFSLRVFCVCLTSILEKCCVKSTRHLKEI